MLVLTRKLMEKLFIGDDICVTVVRLDGGQVRLGIEAPRDVTVVRAELVPERRGPKLKQGPAAPSAIRGPIPIRHELRAPSPAWVRGTDSPRRGRSR
jgi:carbon storage regulator